MIRPCISGLLGRSAAYAVIALGWTMLASRGVRANEPPVVPTTKTATTKTATVSAEVWELARELELLENLELLAQWDMLALMPLLEDDDER